MSFQKNRYIKRKLVLKEAYIIQEHLLSIWFQKRLYARILKRMAFILFLSLFIANHRENFQRGRKCPLSFAMKRDKKRITAILLGSLLEAFNFNFDVQVFYVYNYFLKIEWNPKHRLKIHFNIYSMKNKSCNKNFHIWIMFQK